MLIGNSSSDDAAIYRISPNIALVLTVDFFPPIVDDPFTFGEISAANALSDVYAMGGVPLTALNIVGFPDNLDKSILVEILKGGASKCSEAGVLIVGGHTVTDLEPKYGLAVTGTVTPGSQVSNSGAQEGDLLVLTKPLGTGIITTAGKQGTVDQEILDNAIELMASLNKGAAIAMVIAGANACSDITGFGLLGHLKEICESSKVNARLALRDIPVIEGVMDLVDQGIAPGGTLRNLDYVDSSILWGTDVAHADKVLLCDAQTSGGLLISVPKSRVNVLNKALTENGVTSISVVGEILANTKLPSGKLIQIVS